MWKTAIALVSAAGLALPAGAAATEAQLSVNGTSAANVPYGATNAQQLAAYNRALGAAVDDAQVRAGVLTQQLSLTLGPLESLTEQSEDYLGYCGLGFLPGAASSPAALRAPSASGAAGQLTPIPHRHKRHAKKKSAHKAAEQTCEIDASVTIVYGTS